jgi:type IV secretory pathway TraG/TraD family ATPase VirD4
MDKIISYKKFQNFFNPALSAIKPTKPNRDNPAYHDPTRKAMYSPKKYWVYQIWRYQTDLDRYHLELGKYHQKQQYRRSIYKNFRNDANGYIQFFKTSLSARDTAFFSRPHSFTLSETARQRHSYITGQTGSGKTELLKTLIHHYLHPSTNTALILIDPHGDIAEQVAQFKENVSNGRLVYIDPFLSPDHSPVLNPFQLPYKQTPPAIIDLITEELYLVFRDILKSSFTPQMETLLRPCITTLLLMGDKDINDLQRFMHDDQNQYYLNFSLKNLYNPAQVDFLKNDFYKEVYNPTKQAIKTKLQSLLNSYTFRNLLTGKQTFNLDQLCKQNKLIVFNLSAGKIGNDTSNVIGRFILAQIKSMAFQRADQPESLRTPTHVFIDECQRYISPTIETLLAEARKYKVYLTLANQYYGQNMGTETRNAITNNTAIKIAGRNGDKNATIHHKETGADIEELKSLKIGEFHIKEDTNISVKIKANANLLNHKNAMTPPQWEKVKNQILSDFYRLIEPLPLPSEPQTNTHQVTPEKTTYKPLFDIE